MERLLAVWVPVLGDESPDGATLRTYLALLDALSVLCPFTEPVRLGLYCLPVRGPSRFFGGEGAVLDAVATTVHRRRGRRVATGRGRRTLLRRARRAARGGGPRGGDRGLSSRPAPRRAGAQGPRHHLPPPGPAHPGRLRRPRPRRAWPSASTATRGTCTRWRAARSASSPASATRAWARAWRTCAARPGCWASSGASSASAAPATTAPRRRPTGSGVASGPTRSWWRRCAGAAGPRTAPRWCPGARPRCVATTRRGPAS